MVMTMQVTGMKEVRSFLNKLPKSMKEEVGNKGTTELAKNLQRRIKYRYGSMYGKGPSSSGFGKRSITRTKNKIQIIADYMALIELGKTSSHWVSLNTIRAHKQNPGSTLGRRAEGPYIGPPVWWTYKGSFVKPTMKIFTPEIPRLLNKYINDAISKAGG